METGLEHFEKVVEETANETTQQSTETETKTEDVILGEKEQTAAEEIKEEIKEEVVVEEKPKEEKKEDPLADLPDDVKEYAVAKKENKDLTFEEFQKQKNFDISSLSVLDVAREKAIREGNGKITKENVDAYIEKKTGIVLTDEDVTLDEYDEIDLEKFIGDFRESFDKKTEKEVAEEQPEPQEEFVEVKKGFKIEKSLHEELEKSHLEFVSRMEKAASEVNEIVFNFEFDNNGNKEIIPLSYTTTDADKQLMLSTTKDVNNQVDKMFRDKEENFDDKGFNESILKLNPNSFQKIVNTFINKAVAISTEKLLKQEYNANFQSTHFKQETNPQPQKQTTVYRPPGTLQVDLV